MRQILTFSILFWSFSTIAALDAYNPSLPLDIQSTEAGQDLQPLNLGSVLQNTSPQPCSGGSSNDYALQESEASDDQPVKRNYPFENQEESPEVPINLNAKRQKITIWITSVRTRHPYISSGALLMDKIYRISWNRAFTISILMVQGTVPSRLRPKRNRIPPLDKLPHSNKIPGPGLCSYEQASICQHADECYSEPIEQSCPLLPEGRADGYLVHLVEYQGFVSPRPRNTQAILVSQHRSNLRYRYDVAAGPDRIIRYRKLPGPVFMRGGKVVVLSRFEQRGWLVAWPGEPVELALQFFEALAQSILPPTHNAVTATSKPFTAVWVTKVFNALASSNIGYWVPLSIPARSPP